VHNLAGKECVNNAGEYNKYYPITAAEGEDDNLRKASSMVNQMLDQLKNNYAVRDLQDLLAMCCLELALYKAKTTAAPTIPGESQAQQQPAALPANITGDLGELERRIAEYLAG
jgi:cell division protein ZapA (FtsZ GTPase activity inhibitor)